MECSVTTRMLHLALYNDTCLLYSSVYSQWLWTLGCHMKEWYILSFVYSDIWIMNNTWRSLMTCIQHYPVTTITCSSMYHITAYNWKQQLFWHNEVDTIQELKTHTHTHKNRTKN